MRDSSGTGWSRFWRGSRRAAVAVSLVAAVASAAIAPLPASAVPAGGQRLSSRARVSSPGPLRAPRGRHHRRAAGPTDPPSPSADIYTAVSNLTYPWGTALGTGGNLVIAEGGANDEVIMLAAASGKFFNQKMTGGSFYDLAGIPGTPGYGGAGNGSEIFNPAGVALDANGNLVFSDSTNCIVRVVANTSGSFYQQQMTAGDIYTIAGTPSPSQSDCAFSGDGGAATSAELNEPTGLALDGAGDVLVVDAFDDRVRLVAEQSCSSSCPYGLSSMTKGDIYTVAGDGSSTFSGDGGSATSAGMEPEGAAVDASGNLLIADSKSDAVRVVAESSTNPGYGLASDCGSGGNGTCTWAVGDIFTIAGTPSTHGYSGDGGAATSADLYEPYEVTLDSAGNVVIADGSNNVVRVVAESSSNPGYGLRADCGGGSGTCTWTVGDIYTVAGDGTAGDTGDGGPATSAEIDDPRWVTTDALGQTLVTDATASAATVRLFGGGPLSAESVTPEGSAPGLDLVGGGGGPQPACVCQTGRPVDLANGDYYDTVTDLSIPGAGIPLSFTRTYDALLAQTQAGAAASAPPLGYGWSSNLTMSISYNSTSQVATVTEANGAQIAFQYYPTGSNSVPLWCGALPTYCPMAPRYVASLTSSGTIGQSGSTFTYINSLKSPLAYTFSWSSGTFYTLTGIADANGDTLDAGPYSPGTGQPSCPTGDTCTAWTSAGTGGSGQSLVTETNSSGQLLSVFDPASTNETVSFTYSGTGCSTWANGQPADLCSATDPGALTTSYTYSSTNGREQYQYDEKTTTPPSTGAVTNTYNSTGQVAKQDIAVGSVTEESDFSYASDSGLAGGTTTTVTRYPQGTGTGKPTEVDEYDFSNGVLVEATTGYGGTNPVTTYYQRDPATLVATDTVDGDRNVTAQSLSPAGALNFVTDGAGNTTEYAYTAANLPWCEVDPADYLNGVRCPSQQVTTIPSPNSDPHPGMALTFYNAANEVTARTDPLGNTSVDFYTSGVSGVPNGLLYCSVDPADYDAHYVAGTTCATYGTHYAGGTTTTYDSAGDVLSSTDPDGDVTSYTYGVADHPGLPRTETDPNGTVTTFTYNTPGQVKQEVVSFGGYSATTVESWWHGLLICEIGPYEYAQGVTTCPTSPPTPPTPGSDSWLGRTITTYDQDGRVVQVTNPLGGISYTAYDRAGDVYCTVTAYDANEHGTTCPADTFTTPTPTSDQYLGTTLTSYDKNGRPIQVTNPLGGITLTNYDGAGNAASTTVESATPTSDPNVVTSYTYDGDNRVLSTTLGTGTSAQTSTVAYDPNGDLYCSASANAEASPGGYLCPAWQKSWISPNTTTSPWTDGSGYGPPNPDNLYPTLADNVTLDFYNAGGEKVQETNPDVQTTVAAYDADGRATCTSDPVNADPYVAAHTTGTYPFTYDCPTSPLTTPPSAGSDPGYTTAIYDAAGRVTATSDQVGDTTSYTYDPKGDVLTVTNPVGEVTTDCYYYEAQAGQCAAGVSGGSGDDLYSVTTPITAADPSGERTTYTYYPGGLQHAKVTPAGTTTDAYDAMGDLASESYSATAGTYAVPAATSFTYFPDGSRETMTDGTGTTTDSYDDVGDLQSQAFAPAAGSGLSAQTTSDTYYTTGALASVAYPSYGSYTNPTASYAYDQFGNMASVSDWLSNKVSLSTDGDGNLTAQDNLVSGTQTSGTAFSYDPADQATSAVSTSACNATTALSQSFSGTGGSRNADGQLTEYTAGYGSGCAGTGLERNYSYDIAGRVVYEGSSAQGSSPDNFGYDPTGGNGNDEAEGPTEISNYDGAGNLDSYTQAFDQAGEVTSQTPTSGSPAGVKTTYSYDTLGDLTEAAGATTTDYGYDALGEMTSLSGPGGATGYQYSGDGLEAATTAPKLAWGSAKAVDSTNGLKAVSCATPSFCVAVDGKGEATTYNGSGWSSPAATGDANALNAISCPSATVCVAVDSAGNALTWNGTSWTSVATGDTTALTGISCPSAVFCVAVDGAGNALTYRGSAWSKVATGDANALTGVSCPTTGFCAAVDGAGNALTWNGTSWSAASDIDGAHALAAVSCATALFCAAVDAAGNALVWNGSSWGAAVDVDGTHILSDVSCPTTTFCAAVGRAGTAVLFNGGGWAPAADVDGTSILAGVSCTAPASCEAVDTPGKALGYGASDWASPQDVDGTTPFESVSCATSSFCAAVDEAGDVLTYNGTSWTSPQNLLSYSLLGVSCPTTSSCVAVGAQGAEFTYNGSSWSTTPDDIDGTNALSDVSCPTTSFCAAVDLEGNALTYTSSSGWSSPTSISTSLTSVSCVSSSFCVAVSGSTTGEAYTFNGSSWSGSDIDGSNGLVGVSCASTSFCMVTDADGNVLTWNGTSWSTKDLDGTTQLSGVSCPLPTFCVVGDSTGHAFTYDGSAWSASKDVDSTRAVGRLSCASPSYCVAIDGSGYAVTFSAVTSQLLWGNYGQLSLVLSDGTNYYLYGPQNEPVEQVNVTSSPPAQNPRFLTYTPSDSSWLVTSTSGAQLSFSGYDAYGNLDFGTPLSPFGYAGQYADASSNPSGFADMRSRFYQSQTGEFTTRDQAFGETDQAYSYAGDDPVDGIDPTGLCNAQGNGTWYMVFDPFSTDNPIYCWGLKHPVAAAVVSAVAGQAAADLVCATPGIDAACADAQDAAGWQQRKLEEAVLQHLESGGASQPGPGEPENCGGAEPWGPPRRGAVPPDFWVVKGGIVPPPTDGSVFSGTAGETELEAASGVPHNQVQSTTVAALIAVGGTIEWSPELNRSGTYVNNLHVNLTLSGVNPFGIPHPNPVPTNDRIPS